MDRALDFRDIFGMPVVEFNDRIRSKNLLVVSCREGALDHLLDWELLNGVLNAASLYTDRVSLVKGDLRVDRRRFVESLGNFGRKRISPGAVRGAIDEGYSILLDEIQEYHRPISRVADLLARSLGENVNVNAYVSWRPEKCFNTHWDNHDVIILQTAGEKYWTVYRPTRLNPLKVDIEYAVDKSELEVAWEGILKAGQALYIPRGWWHDAQATDVGSIHLTVGFTGRSVLDLIGFLVTRACSHPELRAELAHPRPGCEAGAGRAELEERLLAFVTEELSGGLVERFWRHHYGNLPNKSVHALPFTIDRKQFGARDYWLQLASLAPAAALAVKGEVFELEYGERRLTLDMIALPFLRLFLGGEPVQLSRALAKSHGLSYERAVDLAFELVNEGVLFVAEPVGGARLDATFAHAIGVVEPVA